MKYLRYLLLFIFLFGFAEVSYSQYGNVNISGTNDEYGINSLNGVLTNLGTGKYAAADHNFILNQGLQGTVEAWVYLTSYNINNSCIYEKGTSFLFGVGTAFVFNRPMLRFNNIVLFPPTGNAVPLNRWVHLAATWQQNGANVTAVFYQDGVLLGAHSQTVTIYNNTDSVTIGGSRIQSNSYVSGYLDEVRYWNRQRSDLEIARNRFCGIGDGLIANQNSALVSAEDYSGLVSSWNFNDDGVTCQDYISLRTAFYRGVAVTATATLGQPIPYNLAAYFPGGLNDHIRVPDNSAFDLTTGGTFDAWVYRGTAAGYTLISKGATANSTTFRVYIASNGILCYQIGSASNFGGTVPLGMWSHVAVSWSGSAGNYIIKFYINGQLTNQAPINTTMPVNADLLRIGNLQWDANNNFNGYMDEVRLWNRALTPDEVKAYMFTSAKTISTFIQTNLVSAWGFEGNLKNSTAVTEINGTFNVGALNKCRFSGFWNENLTGPELGSLMPHTTVINRNESPVNSYPGGFSIKTPYKNLFYDTYQYDTINIPGNVSLSNIEVFLSVNQPHINNLSAYLKAPNGTEKILVSGNGGSGGNILTFFKDGAQPVTGFYNPWSYLAAPLQSFGNFGGTNSQGNWVLRIIHGNFGNTGTLLGWGIRINNSVTAIGNYSNSIPEKFKLDQNYPNPFNPATNIRFDIPFAGNVKITLYDMLGREVQILADEFKDAGSYEINFDGSGLSTGTYFYKITAGNFYDIKKMVLVK